MKIKSKCLVTALALLLVTGCATGISYQEAASTIPAVPSDQGRIYIYRTAVFATGVQPSVRVNGEVVGRARPRGFFYVDRLPGTYEITTATEVEGSMTVFLEAGEVNYVRLDVQLGLLVGRITPLLVNESVGREEITRTNYTGE